MLSGDQKYFYKKYIGENKFLAYLAGGVVLLWGWLTFKCGGFYHFSRLLGKYEKFDLDSFPSHYKAFYRVLAKKRAGLLLESHGSNMILDAYLKGGEAKKISTMYGKDGVANTVRLRYMNEDDDDREGNLLVLKEPLLNDGFVVEKGVLYLQYNHALFEFVALFDLSVLYKTFELIFEPSSWGYSDLAIELLLDGDSKVFVMAQDMIDFTYLKGLDPRLIPIRAGAGDWIGLDGPVFDNAKKFDVCMVASWRKIKNHELMFRQLSLLGKGLRIALVGYPYEGRTAASIRQAQERYYPDSLVSIFESVPHDYVFNVLSASRVALMLSEREGANRGIYEALACDVPVVMLENNRGVNRQLVDHHCVTLTSADNLAATVDKLFNQYPEKGKTREKISSISGCQNTWALLSSELQKNCGFSLSDTSLIKSAPNLKYVSSEVKRQLGQTYAYLQSFLR